MADAMTRKRTAKADTNDRGERNRILAAKLLTDWNPETILKIEWTETTSFKGWVATTTA